MVNEVIKCKVVVVWEVGKFFFIEEIEVVFLKVYEVWIKIIVIVVCYIDVYILSGVDFEGCFLVILGYEGVGIVESVGEGVIKLKVGDIVILFYIL